MSINKGSLAAISTSYNNIEVFAITNDQTGLGRISFNDSAWAPVSLLGVCDCSLYKSAPSAVSTQPGSFDVFAVDISNQILTRNFNGTSWRPSIRWQQIKSNFAHPESGVIDAGSPTAMGPVWDLNTDRYDLHLRKLDGYAITIYNLQEDRTRFGSNFYQEYAKSTPLAVYNGVDKLEFFHTGLDDYFYHAHFDWADSGGWYYTRAIGSQKFISPPAAVNSTGGVHVFGIAPDHTVRYNVFSNRGEAWTGWRQLGSRGFASAISAIIPQGGIQVELWGLGTDGELWHRSGEGDNWTADWVSHKGSFISAPALVSSAPGVYDVFAIGSDGTLKHARNNAGQWTPAYPNWESLGGYWKAFN